VEDRHRRGSFLQYRVAKFNDGIDHSVVFYLLAVALKVAQSLAHRVAAEFFQGTAGQSQRYHAFGGYTCRRNHAYIGTFVGSFHRLASSKVHRLQRTAQRGNRLQIAAYPDFLAIRNPPLDSAGVVPGTREAAKT